MTRKHFEAIAAIIKDNTSYCDNGIPAQIADELATFFEKENIHFDRARFLVACQP